MLPDRVSNPGPLTYESGALPIALRGPARCFEQPGPDNYNAEEVCVAIYIYGCLTFCIKRSDRV